MRDRRLLVLGGVVAAAAVVVVVVILATGGGSGGSTTSTAAPAANGPVTATPLEALQGIPQNGATLGKHSAPTTIEVFEDPQCPFCQQWSLETFPTVVQDYVRTGKIKLVYRGVQIIGPNSTPGLRAIYAAGRQDKLWNLVEELYHRQGPENSGWITPALLRSAATAVGIDPGRLATDAKSAAVTAELKQAMADFASSGADGTPSFFLLQPPAVPQELSLPGLDPTTFTGVLDAALQQR